MEFRMDRSLILNKQRHIILTPQDRLKHMFIAGMPSTGVSAYLLALMHQDLKNGIPVMFFDPYGDLSTRLIETISDERLEKTSYIDVGNTEFPVGINIFEGDSEEERLETVNNVINLLYDLYDPKRTGVIGPRFEHAVRNAILSVYYDKKASFVELLKCLTDKDYVAGLLPKISDPFVKSYWTKQIAQTSDFHKSEILDYIVSKFSKFVIDRKMRNIIAQPKTTIDFKKILDEQDLVIFDLSKFIDDLEGKRIISELILIKLAQEISKQNFKKERAIYFNDVNSYPPLRLSKFYYNARKEKVMLTSVTQDLSDMEPVLRKSFLSSGTIMSFRINTEDARILSSEFHTKTITEDQLCMLKKYHYYLKTLRDGNPVVYEEVNTEGLDLHENILQKNTDKLKTSLHRQNSASLLEVEKEISEKLPY